MILTIFLSVALNSRSEEVVTQYFTSNTESDWQPLVPTTKSVVECVSQTNDLTFTFDNVVQSANGKYLVIYTDGKLTLPRLDGQITKIELQLYAEQPFSSICNVMLDNQQGNRARYMEVDAKDESMLGSFIAFPYDLSLVYPEENTILSLSSEKKLYITAIRITYNPVQKENVEAPAFILPEWMGEEHYFSTPFSLEITSPSPDAVISYAINDGAWTDYTSPIMIGESCKVSAKASKNGADSEIVSTSFTLRKNIVSSIAELKKVGIDAESELSSEGGLTPHPDGLFDIAMSLQVIAHNNDYIFVTDNTDNFHNCITIYAPYPDNIVTDGGIIQAGMAGYYIKMKGVTPTIYAAERVITESAMPYAVSLADILVAPEEYLSKYVSVHDIEFDTGKGVICATDGASMHIENLFGVEMPTDNPTNADGIVVYSISLEESAFAPLSFSDGAAVKSVDHSRPVLRKISELSPDSRVYSLDGVLLNHAELTPGFYILCCPDATPCKVLLR